MPPNDFDDFVKRQQVDEDLNDFWSKEKDDYLKDLTSLYVSIVDYLKPYIHGGTIVIDHYEKSIVEENTGSYVAPGLIIKIGRQSVKFEPVGTQIIGAKGRVDVSGSAGRARIVRVDAKLNAPRVTVDVFVDGRPMKTNKSNETDEPINWQWRIVEQLPKFRFIELNRDSLMNMLMAVSNG